MGLAGSATPMRESYSYPPRGLSRAEAAIRETDLTLPDNRPASRRQAGWLSDGHVRDIESGKERGRERFGAA